MAENTALVKAMVSPEIRDGMERLARMNERSLSAEVRRALREHVRRALAEPGGPRGPSGGVAAAKLSAIREDAGTPGSASDASLATGAGGPVSAGLAVSSAPVASDGALAEPVVASSTNLETRRGIGAGTGLAAAAAAGPGRDDDQATSGERPGSASVSPFVPDALKPHATPAELAASFPGVTTGGELDLRKSQVTPFGKSEQAGRKK